MNRERLQIRMIEKTLQVTLTSSELDLEVQYDRDLVEHEQQSHPCQASLLHLKDSQTVFWYSSLQFEDSQQQFPVHSHSAGPMRGEPEESTSDPII